MARMKDESKRTAILQSSKMLFSQNGFYNTSISDIVKETGLPVGTIYTYFKSKDDIVQDIVEEGWTDFYNRLVLALHQVGDAEAKLKLVLDDFIPELLTDLDLINILLAEAVGYTHIEEKIEKLTDLIFPVLLSLSPDIDSFQGLSRRDMESILAVFFLGILNAVKLSRTTSVNLGTQDILSAVKKIVQTSLRVKL